MARKPSRKKLDKWVCKYGCDVRAKICSHLDAELNGRYNRSPWASRMLNMDDVSTTSFMPTARLDGNRTGSTDPEREASRMRRFLSLYKLEKMDADILVSKFVYNSTYEQISDEFGFTGPVSAWRYFKHLMHKMRMKIKAGRLNE